MRTWFVAPVLALVMLGLDGCTPPKTAAPPPPPPHLGPIERPEDLVGELVVRDPLGFADTVIAASGMKDVDPMAFLQAPEVAAFASVVDLHATAVLAVFGDPRHVDSWHFVGAVHLKDPKDARTKFAEAAAKGKMKASESPAIRSKIYVSGKSSLALLGDALVFADAPTTLESAGRWAGKETDGTPAHEVALHVPLSRWAGPLKAEAKSLVDAELQKDKDMSAAEPILHQLVDVIGDLGDVQMSLDVEKQDAVVDFRLGATGSLAAWLAKYPAGTPRSILALPRGSGAFVVRLPDAVSDTVKSMFDADPAPSSISKKELADARVLAHAIGHEVAVVYAEKAKPGEAPKTTEALVRIELVDPNGAKGAIKSLIADYARKPDRKLIRGPWAKYGADGESLQITDGAEHYDARWAIKGNSLYVDVAWDGKVALIDAAVDPNAKSLLGKDVRAKSFADKLPKEGLAFAYYAQTAAAPKPEELGAVPALEGIRWGWVSASKSGVASAWNVPLADVATYMKK